MTKKLMAAACAVALTAGAAIAAPVFFEDFSDDYAAALAGGFINGDNVAPNYGGFDQFETGDGTVDLYGSPGGIGITCSVACVNLAGSFGIDGLFYSRQTFVAGVDYIFSFVLSGNQVGIGADIVQYGVDSLFDVLTVAPDDGFETYSLAFRGTGGVQSIFFQNAGSGDLGAILDSVRVDVAAVPVPASLPLLAGGLALLGLAQRRRT